MSCSDTSVRKKIRTDLVTEQQPARLEQCCLFVVESCWQCLHRRRLWPGCPPQEECKGPTEERGDHRRLGPVHRDHLTAREERRSHLGLWTIFCQLCVFILTFKIETNLRIKDVKMWTNRDLDFIIRYLMWCHRQWGLFCNLSADRGLGCRPSNRKQEARLLRCLIYPYCTVSVKTWLDKRPLCRDVPILLNPVLIHIIGFGPARARFLLCAGVGSSFPEDNWLRGRLWGWLAADLHREVRV